MPGYEYCEYYSTTTIPGSLLLLLIVNVHTIILLPYILLTPCSHRVHRLVSDPLGCSRRLSSSSPTVDTNVTGIIITIMPVVTKDLPISPRFTPCNFLLQCKFSNLTTRQPMVECYLLTFPRFPLRKKEHKSYFGKNRTHDFRTSRCAGYLLDHSGDEYHRSYLAPTLSLLIQHNITESTFL